jgi:hypothetical protein
MSCTCTYMYTDKSGENGHWWLKRMNILHLMLLSHSHVYVQIHVSVLDKNRKDWSIYDIYNTCTHVHCVCTSKWLYGGNGKPTTTLKKEKGEQKHQILLVHLLSFSYVFLYTSV